MNIRYFWQKFLTVFTLQQFTLAAYPTPIYGTTRSVSYILNKTQILSPYLMVITSKIGTIIVCILET